MLTSWTGKYLGDAAVKALPKAKEQSLMPGYNVFGDGFFFGEGMLKDVMAPVSCSCAGSRPYLACSSCPA